MQCTSGPPGGGIVSKKRSVARSQTPRRAFRDGIQGRKNSRLETSPIRRAPFSNITCLLQLSANGQMVQFSLSHSPSLFFIPLTIFMWLWPARCWWMSVINTPLKGASKFQRSTLNLRYDCRLLVFFFYFFSIYITPSHSSVVRKTVYVYLMPVVCTVCQFISWSLSMLD